MGSFMERVVKLIMEAMMGQTSLSFISKQMHYTDSVFNGFSSAASASGTPIGIFYTILMSCGMGILLIYWLVNMLDDFKLKKVSLEWFVRHMARLVLSIMLLSNALPVLVYLVNFGDAMAVQLANGLSSSASTAVPDQIPHAIAAVRIYVYNAIFPLQLIYFAKLLLPWLFLFLIRIFIYAFLLARVVELVARICFSPLVLPRLFPGGKRSQAFTYLKRLAAVALQVFTISVCVWAGSALCLTFMQNNGSMKKIADALKTMDSTATNADALLSSYAGASASSENVGFNPYGDNNGQTDDAGSEDPGSSSSSESAEDTLEAVEEAGRKIFKAAFTVKNIAIMLGVYGSVMAVIARSRSITEDIIS